MARNFGFTSRLISWDKFRSFHIRMAVCALCLTCLHDLGHLSGSFVHATDPQSRGAVVNLFGRRWDTASYGLFVRSLPGWTGLTCFMGLFDHIPLQYGVCENPTLRDIPDRPPTDLSDDIALNGSRGRPPPAISCPWLYLGPADTARSRREVLSDGTGFSKSIYRDSDHERDGRAALHCQVYSTAAAVACQGRAVCLCPHP